MQGRREAAGAGEKVREGNMRAVEGEQEELQR